MFVRPFGLALIDGAITAKTPSRVARCMATQMGPEHVGKPIVRLSLGNSLVNIFSCIVVAGLACASWLGVCWERMKVLEQLND